MNNDEKRLENIENMLTHIHRHLERALEKIELHDKRLTRLAGLLLDKHPEMEIDSVLNLYIDVSDKEEYYTPINEKDKIEHLKRLKDVNDVKKEEDSRNDL